MNNVPSNLEYCDELARYIERASCAVSVLGELLVALPEQGLLDTNTEESLGYLLQLVGDGMMHRSLDAYAFIARNNGSRVVANAKPP